MATKGKKGDKSFNFGDLDDISYGDLDITEFGDTPQELKEDEEVVVLQKGAIFCERGHNVTGGVFVDGCGGCSWLQEVKGRMEDRRMEIYDEMQGILRDMFKVCQFYGSSIEINIYHKLNMDGDIFEKRIKTVLARMLKRDG